MHFPLHPFPQPQILSQKSLKARREYIRKNIGIDNDSEYFKLTNEVTLLVQEAKKFQEGKIKVVFCTITVKLQKLKQKTKS